MQVELTNLQDTLHFTQIPHQGCLYRPTCVTGNLEQGGPGLGLGHLDSSLRQMLRISSKGVPKEPWVYVM